MEIIDQTKLVTKLLAASTILENNHISKANYIHISIDKIDNIAKELNVDRNEVIYIMQEYFNSK